MLDRTAYTWEGEDCWPGLNWCSDSGGRRKSSVLASEPAMLTSWCAADKKTKEFQMIDNKYWSLFYHITGSSSKPYCGFEPGGSVINLPPGSGYVSMVLLLRIRFRIRFLTIYQDVKKLRKKIQHFLLFNYFLPRFRKNIFFNGHKDVQVGFGAWSVILTSRIDPDQCFRITDPGIRIRKKNI